MYSIHVLDFKNLLGFQWLAGTHRMWEDPDRRTGGKNLHVSVHDPADNGGILRFSSLAVKTGRFAESFGDAVDDDGRLRRGRNSQGRYAQLTRSEKDALNDLVDELERPLLRNRY
jgi:hypothetical protein